MATTFNLESGFGNTTTSTPTKSSDNFNYWNKDFTPCLSENKIIGFSLAESTVDLMGKKIDKK